MHSEDDGRYGPWETTPRWHWRYWVGYRMRRYISDHPWGYHDDRWEYMTFGQYTRWLFAMKFNNGDLGSEKACLQAIK